jgi:DNA-binding PadR family transcriptional regulator
MSPRPRRSPTLVAILQALAAGSRYGFDIIDATSLPSGTVYPALGRLEDEGCVSSRWEDHRIAQREKRPPRRYYELTAAGDRALADAVREYRTLERTVRARARAAAPQPARNKS